MNEHVTSLGFTFSQHMSMAQAWCQYSGQRGTEKQALRVMRQLTAPDLVRMLGERKVALPLGCEAPVFKVGDAVDVLHAVHLPREIVAASGVIVRISSQSSNGASLYWIEGLPCARTANVLRHAEASR